MQHPPTAPSDRQRPNCDPAADDRTRPSLRAVTEIVRLLRQRNQRLVLAESCTAGLIAATFSRLPGVSDVLAGSAVVYQPETKSTWLNVGVRMLADAGVVSREVAEAMANGVLAVTPHAAVALSITGHLGPGAPPELDGIAWCSIAQRDSAPVSRRLILGTAASATAGGAGQRADADDEVQMTIRDRRQCDAVRQATELLESWLRQSADPGLSPEPGDTNEQATETSC